MAGEEPPVIRFSWALTVQDASHAGKAVDYKRSVLDLRSGDRFRITLRPETPCCFYLFLYDSQHRLFLLFPESLGFDKARVEAFMLATFDYFMNTKISWLGYPADDNRLVQAWNWYSLDDDQFEGYDSHNHLLDPSTRQLTALGRAYRDYTASLP